LLWSVIEARHSAIKVLWVMAIGVELRVQGKNGMSRNLASCAEEETFTENHHVHWRTGIDVEGVCCCHGCRSLEHAR